MRSTGENARRHDREKRRRACRRRFFFPFFLYAPFGPRLWPNLHRRPQRDEVPDFLDLAVRQGDAPAGPIEEVLHIAHPQLLLAQAMDRDVTAGRYAERIGPLQIVKARVRQMESPVENTVADLVVNEIEPLGRPIVALHGFWTDGVAAQGDPVYPHFLMLPDERHRPLRFLDNDAVHRFVYRSIPVRGRRERDKAEQKPRSEHERDEDSHQKSAGAHVQPRSMEGSRCFDWLLVLTAGSTSVVANCDSGILAYFDGIS